MRSALLALILATVSTSAAADGGVRAVTLDGDDGFFVPSALFREFERRYEAEPSLRLELESSQNEAESLRLSRDALSVTSSISVQRMRVYQTSWRGCEEQLEKTHDLAIEAAQRSWYESPALWVAVGAAATIGVAAAVKRAARPGE